MHCVNLSICIHRILFDLKYSEKHNVNLYICNNDFRNRITCGLVPDY